MHSLMVQWSDHFHSGSQKMRCLYNWTCDRVFCLFGSTFLVPGSFIADVKLIRSFVITMFLLLYSEMCKGLPRMMQFDFFHGVCSKTHNHTHKRVQNRNIIKFNTLPVTVNITPFMWPFEHKHLSLNLLIWKNNNKGLYNSLKVLN